MAVFAIDTPEVLGGELPKPQQPWNPRAAESERRAVHV